MITSFFAPKRKTENSGEEDDANVTAVSPTPAVPQAPNNAKRLKTITPEAPNASLSPHVQDLMSNLTDDSWKEALTTYVSKPSFASLAAFIASEREKKSHIYPPPSDTFTALNLVPLHKVKVVIVGQDPYHGPGQGHGLAFSVRKNVKIPPSLRNIYKELLNNDCGLNAMPTHGYLERWARQGVLMINSVLTVRKGEANSHAKRGWEDFTDEIIRLLFTQRSKDADGLIFLLWGIPASKKAESIINRYSKDLSRGANKTKPVVICSSHPSPLGATKTKAPFIGSKCFRRANSALDNMGLSKIDWGVDGAIKVEEDDSADDKS